MQILNQLVQYGKGFSWLWLRARNGTVLSPADTDGDAFPDSTDNCPRIPNPDQAGFDEDGVEGAYVICPRAAISRCDYLPGLIGSIAL